MFCSACGAQIDHGMTFCSSCGAPLGPPQPTATQAAAITPGFSPRINDPAFAAYIQKSRKTATVFGVVLSIIAFVGFTIYGISQDNLAFGLMLGVFIGGMFLIVSLVTLVRSKSGGTWDGTVIDKKVKKRRRQRRDSGHSSTYNEYILYIKDDNGKTHKQASTHTSAVFDYYRIGERVRRHPGLQYYEKHDKSGDAEILCKACLGFNPAHANTCSRCKCPVLK